MRDYSYVHMYMYVGIWRSKPKQNYAHVSIMEVLDQRMSLQQI